MFRYAGLAGVPFQFCKNVYTTLIFLSTIDHFLKIDSDGYDYCTRIVITVCKAKEVLR